MNSFIFFITMIDIIMYLVTLIMTFAKGYSLDSNQFLGPSFFILDDFGGQRPCKIRNGQIYRLIMPMFLHAGFLHIFVSIIMT